MTKEEINTMKYKVCCPMCDNKKCVRGSDTCEAEIWAKNRELEMYCPNCECRMVELQERSDKE